MIQHRPIVCGGTAYVSSAYTPEAKAHEPWTPVQYTYKYYSLFHSSLLITNPAPVNIALETDYHKASFFCNMSSATASLSLTHGQINHSLPRILQTTLMYIVVLFIKTVSGVGPTTSVRLKHQVHLMHISYVLFKNQGLKMNIV